MALQVGAEDEVEEPKPKKKRNIFAPKEEVVSERNRLRPERVPKGFVMDPAVGKIVCEDCGYPQQLCGCSCKCTCECKAEESASEEEE